MRPSQGLGEQGKIGIKFMGTGEQMPIFGGGGEQGNKDNIWEQRTLENKFSIFGEQWNKTIYFRGRREQIPLITAAADVKFCDILFDF